MAQQLLTLQLATQRPFLDHASWPAPIAAVREADLMPSVALLFRWTGQSATDMAHVPALRNDLLRSARPAAPSY